jgi:hypothetical protein
MTLSLTELLDSEFNSYNNQIKKLTRIIENIKQDVVTHKKVLPITMGELYHWYEEYNMFINVVDFRINVDQDIFEDLMQDWTDPYSANIDIASLHNTGPQFDEIYISQSVVDDFDEMIKEEIEKRRKEHPTWPEQQNDNI